MEESPECVYYTSIHSRRHCMALAAGVLRIRPFWRAAFLALAGDARHFAGLRCRQRNLCSYQACIGHQGCRRTLLSGMTVSAGRRHGRAAVMEFNVSPNFCQDLATARKLGNSRFHFYILAGWQQLTRVCVGCAEQGNLEMLRLAQEAAGRVAGMETRLALDCPSARQRTPAMLACHHGCVSSPWIVTPPGSAAVRCTSPSWPRLLHGCTEACPHRRAEIWPIRLPAAIMWLSGHSASIHVTRKAAGAGGCCDMFGGGGQKQQVFGLPAAVRGGPHHRHLQRASRDSAALGGSGSSRTMCDPAAGY